MRTVQLLSCELSEWACQAARSLCCLQSWMKELTGLQGRCHDCHLLQQRPHHHRTQARQQDVAPKPVCRPALPTTTAPLAAPLQHSVRLVACRCAPREVATSGPTSGHWDQQTRRLVSLSTFFFLFLLLPQIWKNAAALLAGDTALLASLSWVVRPEQSPAAAVGN